MSMATPSFVDIDLRALAAKQQRQPTAAAGGSATPSAPVPAVPAPQAELPSCVPAIVAAAHKAEGNAAFGAGQFGRALESYRQAIAASEAGTSDQSTGDVYVAACSNAAEACLRLGRWACACAFARQAIAHHPTHAKACFRYATALLKRCQGPSQASDKACDCPTQHGGGTVGSRQLIEAAGVVMAARQAAAGAPTARARTKRERSAATRLLASLDAAVADLRAAAAKQDVHASATTPTSAVSRVKPPITVRCLPAPLHEGFQYLPSPDGTDANLLVLLHGSGDSATGFSQLAKALRLPQTAALILNGFHAMPLDLPGRTWFEEYSPMGEELSPKAVADGAHRAASIVAGALQGLSMWPVHNIHLVGLGVGATVALHVACTMRLGSVVAAGGEVLGHAVGAGSGAGAGVNRTVLGHVDGTRVLLVSGRGCESGPTVRCPHFNRLGCMR